MSDDARFARIEQENRKCKALATIAVLSTAVLACMGASRGEGDSYSDEFRARRFVLLDTSGKTVGVLGIDDDANPTLMLTKSGKDHGVKCVGTDSGGHIHILSPTGRKSILLNCRSSDSDLGLFLNDGRATTRLTLDQAEK